jgi:outer membrane protein assembly factor BamD (BamD/ComL family)
MKIRNMAWFLFVAVLVASCVTKPVDIPEGLSQAELIQKGQEASDRNRYPVALQYYETIIQRFPYDIDGICAAEYEIAFIHYKQKKYDIAKIEFNNLLERYNTPDEELLPQQFKILSRIVLQRIADIESQKGSISQDDPQMGLSTE